MSAEQDKRPKRHCMVVHAYYPVGETRVQREALALVSQGYEVDVLCLRGEGEQPRDEEDGVQIYRLPMKRHKGSSFPLQLLEYLAFFVLVFGKLVRLHASRRYGTVQVHNLPDFLVFAALFPKVTGARVILDLHDLMPEFFAAKTGSAMTDLPVRLVIWQEQLSCRFADHVITVTDVWRETLIRRGVPEHKVSVVMNVADSAVFRRREGQVSQNGDGFGLIYHGTFTHRYGVDLIVRAVEEVREEIPGIRLTLLGRGETLEDLIQLTETLNLEEHVTIGGTLHVSQLPPLIAEADVGIVPNRSNIFTDGLLPTKLMEYVALGTPVIAARTPTIAAYFDESMVQFFEPGSVEDLAHSILSLYGDRERLSRLAMQADRFNRRYSWERVAADYVALVDRMNNRR